MRNLLTSKNMMGFVDGMIKIPEDDSLDYMMWMCCDAMIKGFLTTTMEKTI